ncbi:MAG: antitoxin Xre/MbcA/ParS toxin-binding domain-containing protein [Parvibaculaceae bacterium]
MSTSHKMGEKAGKLRVSRTGTRGRFLHASKKSSRLTREEVLAARHASEKTHFHAASILERVRRQREGVPSAEAVRLQQQLDVPASLFQTALGIPPATFKKKIRAKKPFTGSAGYAISDLEELVEIAEKLLPAEASRKIDIRKWFGNWMQIPQPALAGHAPKDILDQPAGREAVKRVLGALASGAYL